MIYNQVSSILCFTQQEQTCLGMKRSETLLNNGLTILYLAAYHEVGRAVCVGSYGENGIVEAVLHVLRHPGLQETLQDVRADVLFLETRCCSFLAKVTTDLSEPPVLFLFFLHEQVFNSQENVSF